MIHRIANGLAASRRCLLIISLLVFANALVANALESVGLGPDRSTDWSMAGREAPRPTDFQVLNFLEHGGKPDNQTDNAPILQALIDKAEPGTTIYIPTGSYLFRSPISITRDAITLLGNSTEHTHLRFDLPEAGPHALIMIEGTYTSDPISLNYTPRLGDSHISLPPDVTLKSGHDLIISQQNDLEAMGTYRAQRDQQERHLESLETWAKRSVGQSLAIASIVGNSAILKYPLTCDYNWEDVHIQAVDFLQDVGLVNLTIENTRELDGLHSIAIHRAANCWVSAVRSLKTVRSHLDIRYSRNIEVHDSEFYDSFRHGGGGHGYGIVCSKYTNHCLIENNVFSRLRHSMMVKEGANANVFGYNYSFDGHQEGTAVAKDISIHGHYPFKNLFEGNHVEYIHSSDYWGAAGPGNTFFRNFVSKAALHLEDFSPKQNAIANDLQPIPESPDWLYTGQTTRYENGVAVGKEVIDPLIFANRTSSVNEAKQEYPNSLYLKERPVYWPREFAWPPFGPDTEFGQGKLLAHELSK
ncbi:glycosyl hydrolase family 28-related protein [Pelagicoccus mobilis]|uniref:Rhamnogalacturonase A/B/Epimerase-like pectate lyase domain-containing protein n=1 Tax=Pelagicoccus mobilis TaxID=415221 RepID=A0A934VRI4_9BACT|nr:glycosyl hydrolase family 28-related protein [Pelagicoccus mobilis]MBK1877643.1 hypothetical protein [Pelagicoccus mobilis]